MKKLMMAVAVVAMAIVANAAQITWNSGAIKLASGTAAGAGDVTAYLFVIDASAYSSLLVNTTGATLSDAVWTSYGSDLASAKATQVSVKKGSKANLTDPSDYTNGNTAYAAIPEPTSGLLMLLGMAGLALKRKRA